MEKVKQPKHECFNCGNYRPYYIKKDICFERTSCGFCKIDKQLKDHHETCECWRSKIYRILSVRYGATRVLRDLLFSAIGVKANFAGREK